MTQVHTRFDCKHEKLVDVDIDNDVIVPEKVRGLGKCPECQGLDNMIAVSGIAPQIGGKSVVLDTILMMPM